MKQFVYQFNVSDDRHEFMFIDEERLRTYSFSSGSEDFQKLIDWINKNVNN